MSKRRYTKMQELLPTIGRMIETGMRHREIETELGLSENRVQMLPRQKKPRNVSAGQIRPMAAVVSGSG